MSRVLLGASGLTMVGAGIAATFLPHEILRWAGMDPTGLLPLLVQLQAAALMGLGALNWMSKENLVGGIYARPLVIGNLLHFLVGALALMKAVPTGMPPVVLVTTVVYALFATGFGWALFTSPVKAKS